MAFTKKPLGGGTTIPCKGSAMKTGSGSRITSDVRLSPRASRSISWNDSGKPRRATRIFKHFQSVAPFCLRNPWLFGIPLMRCHPERSSCFAKRSSRGVEGPSVSVGRDKWRKAFSVVCQVRIPGGSIARPRTTGSFDSVMVRFANDHFAQDDTSMVPVNL
jgi:hypothetical protein